MSYTQENNLNAEQIASDCIRDLKLKHPNLSSSEMARRIGMPQSTFSRIENKQTVPSLNSISKLLAATSTSYSISDAIKLTEPSLAINLEKNMSHNINTPMMNSEMGSHFKNPEYRKIILLALTKSGTSVSEVKEQFGLQGLKNLEVLLNSKILEEKNGIISGGQEKLSIGQEEIKEALTYTIKNNYDAEGLGKGQNWLSLQTESINKSKAMKLIHSKLQETYKDIKEILYSPEYEGNDKIFVGMVADSLLKSTSDNLGGSNE